VAAECFEDAEQVLQQNGIPRGILIQKWYYKASFLQPARQRARADESFLTAEEQILVNRRYLGEVVKLWQEHQGGLTRQILGSLVKDVEVQKFINVARKFATGMRAQEATTGVTIDDCVEEFASGALDGRSDKQYEVWGRWGVLVVCAGVYVPMSFCVSVCRSVCLPVRQSVCMCVCACRPVPCRNPRKTCLWCAGFS